eukprot:gene7577-10325_t
MLGVRNWFSYSLRKLNYSIKPIVTHRITCLSTYTVRIANRKINRLFLPTAIGCIYAVNNLTFCDTSNVVSSSQSLSQKEEVVPPATLIKLLYQSTEKILTYINNMLRYLQRLLTYTLLGVPLVVMAPVAYQFGDTFPAFEHFVWDYAIWAIVSLGPTFIKLAQWASTRPDLFPLRLIDKLVSLQDDVKTNHSIEVIENTLAEAFGADWKDKIELDPKPLAAGSVAQVFKGKLLSKNNKNVNVAIKMIHPHVESLVKIDMELLSHIATFIDSFPSLEILSIGETCRQFADTMHNQLDLRKEASNLIQFAKKFKNENWALFPSPIEGFITKNVLVETLMDGSPISSFMNLKAEIGDSVYNLKMKLSDLGVRLMIKMVFFDNFIHGDLHPGNLLVQIQPNGEPRLVVLDCGIVYSSKSEVEHANLVEICLSFMQHNGRRAAQLMVDQAQQSVKNAADFCDSVQQIVDDSEDQLYFEHIGEYVSRICELARKHIVRLDPGYFKIAMALKVAEGISLSLNRDLDMVSKCVPIIIQARTMRSLGLTKFPTPEEEIVFKESSVKKK